MPVTIEGGAKTAGGKSTFGVAIPSKLKDRLDQYLAKVGVSRNSFVSFSLHNELNRQSYLDAFLKNRTQQEAGNEIHVDD